MARVTFTDRDDKQVCEPVVLDTDCVTTARTKITHLMKKGHNATPDGGTGGRGSVWERLYLPDRSQRWYYDNDTGKSIVVTLDMRSEEDIDNAEAKQKAVEEETRLAKAKELKAKAMSISYFALRLQNIDIDDHENAVNEAMRVAAKLLLDFKGSRFGAENFIQAYYLNKDKERPDETSV